MRWGKAVTELVRFELAEGGSVVAELDGAPGVSRAGRQGVLETARSTLEGALTEVRDAAAATLAQFQDMARKPDEVEIKFGVKLDAQAGAIIARTGMQGHFEVTVKWKQES
jgi:hypothetical protein